MTSMICGNVIQSQSTYEWSVDKFSKRCKTFGESICSPLFLLGAKNEFTWQVQIYPYGYREEHSGYLSIFLYSRNHVTVQVGYEFNIKFIFNMDAPEKYRNTFKPAGSAYGYCKFIERNKVLNRTKYMKDVLTQICNFDNVTIIQNTDDSLIDNPKFEILDNIRQLLINQDFCYVTIKVNEKEFGAHKVILSSRSKVFAAMFNHDMVENVKNVVKIEDIDCEVFEALLKFIYIGEVENFDRIAELLVAEDVYAIDRLKNICVSRLCNTINTDNAIGLLRFADLYNVHKLKTKTIQFIANNAKDMIQKPEFKFIKDNPDLLFELFNESSKK